MNDDLFFVPILAEAVESAAPTTALKQAFETMRLKVCAPETSNGLRQWRELVEAATAKLDEHERMAIADAAIWMAIARLCGEDEETEGAHIGPRHVGPAARGREDLNMMRTLRAVGRRRGSTFLVVQRESRPVASWCLDPMDRTSFDGVRPGIYSFRLDTGRVLWSGAITETELIWDSAFPNRPLPMAADSTLFSTTPTKTIPLTVAPIAIAVYPGMEAGTLQLESLDPTA
ncbi:MAG: hypothetical protein J5J06_15410 [Phycisphaerae bacterium]|nr:hypothetical protein [Phycisphaerae bacterium]